MKKGDIRKKEILETAEELFCKNGYIATSIQNILEYLNISKGSLYHHFDSKETILEEIFRLRARKISAAVISGLNEKSSPEERLHLLLSGMIPFTNEKLEFILMLMPLYNLPEGRLIRLTFNETLKKQFSAITEETISAGNQTGDFYCNEPAIAAELLLNMISGLWNRIFEILIQNESLHRNTDLFEFLRLSEYYELAIEKILSLPYGTLVLTDMAELKSLFHSIHSQWPSAHYSTNQFGKEE